MQHTVGIWRCSVDRVVDGHELAFDDVCFFARDEERGVPMRDSRRVRSVDAAA